MSTTVPASLLAQATGVTRRFGSFVAVDDVDLQLAPGEVVGLLGANGAGKTTLIRMLLGLLRPSDGEVALFGRRPSRGTRSRLGYVPQSLGLYDDLTPDENMEFSRAAFAHADRASSGRNPAPVLTAPDVPVGQLALGTQRRVAFAQALDHDPDLLVLDEPTSGVDPLARARLWDTIRSTAEGGAGVLVTTHNMEEAEECDRLVVMATGRVIAEGTATEIVGDTTVTTADADDWAAAFDALDATGLPVTLVGRSLRIPDASPDDVRQLLNDIPGAVRVDQVPATLEERFSQLVSDSATISEVAPAP